MQSMLDLYKDISKEIIEILKCEDIDNDILDNNFEKRQEIIDKLENDKKLEQFRIAYKNQEIYKIDEEIKKLIQEKLLYVKKEIAGYKKSQQGNFAYANMNKLNLNIFSKKV